MGLFGPSKTAEEKLKETFDKWGLDLNNYDERKIADENAKNIKEIATDIQRNKYFKAGMALSFASADKQAVLGYLSAIVNQNWILIRQNELIIRALKKK